MVRWGNISLVILYSAMLACLEGCSLPQLKTNSFVHGDMRLQGNMKVAGDMKVAGRVRTELAPVVDVGPLEEIPIGGPVVAGVGKVAVIDVDGVLTNLNHVGPYSLGENPVAVFKEKLDAAARDPLIKAVVLRINTPGGGVAATDLMWHELQCFRQSTQKPVVACLLDLATGGGYFLAAGCDQILAIPSSVVGGIGVILNVYFAREGIAMMNVFDDSIRAGDKIDMGSPVRQLEKEERQILREMAKGYHDRFKEIVSKSRPRLKVTAGLFDGRVYTGPQAVEIGLADGTGYLNDAIQIAIKLSRTRGLLNQECEFQPIMYRRAGDSARSLYATSPNRPIHSSVLPMSIPGMDRSKLPLFLYMWQADPTLLKSSGT